MFTASEHWQIEELPRDADGNTYVTSAAYCDDPKVRELVDRTRPCWHRDFTRDVLILRKETERGFHA